MEKRTDIAKAPEASAAFGFSGQSLRFSLWPMQTWLQWQAHMMNAAKPVAAEWMERRREGAEAALQALERLCACQDVQEASKVQTEWAEEERKRLEQDVSAIGATFSWPSEFAKSRDHLPWMEPTRR